jgi:hypothetical protein
MDVGRKMEKCRMEVEWKLDKKQQNGRTAIVESWNGKTAQARKCGTTKPQNHGMAECNETGLDYNWLRRDD